MLGDVRGLGLASPDGEPEERLRGYRLVPVRNSNGRYLRSLVDHLALRSERWRRGAFHVGMERLDDVEGTSIPYLLGEPMSIGTGAFGDRG